MAKEDREVSFNAVIEDDGRIRVSKPTSNTPVTRRGREWRQATSEHQEDWLVLDNEHQAVSLIRELASILAYVSEGARLQGYKVL